VVFCEARGLQSCVCGAGKNLWYFVKQEVYSHVCSYLHHKHMTVNLLLHKIPLQVLTYTTNTVVFYEARGLQSCVCGVGKNLWYFVKQEVYSHVFVVQVRTCSGIL
jgi:hypothetical protein